MQKNFELEKVLLKNIMLECNKINFFKKDFKLLFGKPLPLTTTNALAEKICENNCTARGAVKIIMRLIDDGVLEKRDGIVYALPKKITEYFVSKEPDVMILLSGKYEIVKK